MKLADCRREIDSIDAEILSLLNRRAEVAEKVGLLKAKAGIPIVDLDREDEILHKILRGKKGLLEDDSIVKIFCQIILESRHIQVKAIAKVLKKETEICS